MKILDFAFETLPDSAQYATDTLIYAFHEMGFIEFRGYCMINSQARPVDLEIEAVGANEYCCHVVTACPMTAMSEKCILVNGKLECREVNHQLRLTVCQKIVADDMEG